MEMVSYNYVLQIRKIMSYKTGKLCLTKAYVRYDGVHTKRAQKCARYYSQRKKVINIFDVSLFCPIYKMVLAGGDVHPGSSATSVASSFLPGTTIAGNTGKKTYNLSHSQTL